MSNHSAEKSTIGKRLSRYGRVSGTMMKLATRLAGERYFGIKIEREEHARQLTEALGNLKGPLMKVGQILATIPEALPKEYADELRQLQADAPPMGWPFVKRRMAAELGPNWVGTFKDFSRNAAAAASLGQVHKATLHDGRAAACKLQYPDMQSAIDADLRQLKIIFSIFEKYDKAISTQHIHEELSARLYEELDYTLEAKYCRMYRHILRDESNIHVPEIIDDLSTDRLLTATWLDGDKILNYVDVNQADKKQIALNMFRAWYVPLYYYGMIHGDPHLGNYSVRPDLSINLLDFGCVRVFRPAFVQGVIDLYHALQRDDMDLAVHAYETWGFGELSKETIEILNIWAGFLYGPILDDRERTIGEANKGVYGRETATKVHEELRKTAGSIVIPREFVFMDRAALGLGSVFIHLKAEVNWYRLFNEMIEGFDVDTVKDRQEKLLKKFEINGYPA